MEEVLIEFINTLDTSFKKLQKDFRQAVLDNTSFTDCTYRNTIWHDGGIINDPVSDKSASGSDILISPIY
ncbi:MAG: hypothetical protein WCO29_02040 [Nostocales cyanobacterium ELA583]|jgi:hypothetical protein